VQHGLDCVETSVKSQPADHTTVSTV